MRKEKQVYKGRLLKVFLREQKLPNAYQVKLELIKHPGAALIVPVFSDGSIILIRQFRPVINKYIWELPAGTLESGEKPINCARRELIEETGYSAKKIIKLGEIVPVPGYSTEKILIFKATDLIKCQKNNMADEVISEKIFSRKQVLIMIKRGQIIDAKTICGLSFLFI